MYVLPAENVFRSTTRSCHHYHRRTKRLAFYGITNGVTEGVNNKIKVLKRNSYGIRNFNRFRTQILHPNTCLH
nr:transposase [uncultured Clostridium sp.]